MTLEALAPGPYVGCTWGGSRPFGPAAFATMAICPREARWLRYDAHGYGWFLCDTHVGKTL